MSATVDKKASDRSVVPATSSEPVVTDPVNESASLSGQFRDMLDLCQMLSLVYFLLHTPLFWYARGPLSAFALGGICSRKLRNHPVTWLGIAASILGAVILNWFSSDNHKYVGMYWAITMACVCWEREHKRVVLARSAGWIIGLCMFFATLWKFVSPTYLSNDFFEFTMLTDDRFSTFLATVTPLKIEALDRNLDLYVSMLGGSSPPGTKVELAYAPTLTLVAYLCTYWTIIIEGLIALLFMAPDSPRIRHCRNVGLIAFGATTYFLAPVPGFGCLLMLMGMAQTRSDETLYFKLYLVLFIVIQSAPFGVRSLWQFVAT